MQHELNHEINRLQPLKSAILLIMLFADIISVVFFSTLTYFDYIYLLPLFIEIFLSLGIKYSTVFLTYKFTYLFKNETFTITKINPIKMYNILSLTKNDIYNIEKITEKDITYKLIKSNYKDAIILCDMSCPNSIYMLKLQGKKYVISVDDYMLALLLQNNYLNRETI